MNTVTSRPATPPGARVISTDEGAALITRSSECAGRDAEAVKARMQNRPNASRVWRLGSFSSPLGLLTAPAGSENQGDDDSSQQDRQNNLVPEARRPSRTVQKRGGHGTQEAVVLVHDVFATRQKVSGLWRRAWSMVSTPDSLESPDGFARRRAVRSFRPRAKLQSSAAFPYSSGARAAATGCIHYTCGPRQRPSRKALPEPGAGRRNIHLPGWATSAHLLVLGRNRVRRAGWLCREPARWFLDSNLRAAYTYARK